MFSDNCRPFMRKTTREKELFISFLSVLLIVFLCSCKIEAGAQSEESAEYRYYFKIVEAGALSNEVGGAGNHLSLAGNDADISVEVLDYAREHVTTEQLISEFCSLGHAPSITLWNSTWRQVFTSADDVYNACDAWIIEFLRSQVSRPATKPTSTEQWMLVVELDTGVELFTTFGTLLDTGIEPVLQWDIGDPVADLPPESKANIETAIIVNSPCAADVAIIFPVIKSSNNDVKSLFAGVSYQALAPGTIKWFEPEIHDAPNGSYVVDAALTNQHLLVLLDSGLYVSNCLVEKEIEHHEEEEDHEEVAVEEEEEKGHGHGHKRRRKSEYGRGHGRQRREEEDHEEGSEIIFREVHGPWHEEDHAELCLTYTSVCLCREGDDMQSDIVVIGPRNQTRESWCYMQPPYTELHCFDSFAAEAGLSHVISLAYNAHMKGLTMAFETKDGDVATQAWLLDDHYELKEHSLHPPFVFPSSFRLNKMEFHPKTNSLFAYGNEVWSSVDGGNFFRQMMVLENGDCVVQMSIGKQSGDVVLMSTQGYILYGKSGIARLAKMSPAPMLTCLTTYVPLVDHRNSVHLIGWCNVSGGETKLWREMLNVKETLETLDQAFPCILVPLILSERNLFLFEYSPLDTKSKFHLGNIGQLIVLKKGGSALIKERYLRTYDTRFVSLLQAHIHIPFHYENINDSPAQNFDVEISPSDVNHLTDVTLKVTNPANNPGWLATDVGKTVWIAGGGSFLITAVIDNLKADGISVLPLKEKVNAKRGYWYMYDFGVSGGIPQWKLQEDECHQTLLAPENLTFTSYVELDLKQKFEITMVSSLQEGGIPSSHELHASLSNPWHFNIKPNYLIQGNGYHSLTISLDAYVNRKGKTAINFKMSKSSLLCKKTSHTIIIASACPYGTYLKFHHEVDIANNVFLHGEQYNDKGISVLFDLPVNYRPPSALGVEIPISDNIYNADPSQPLFNSHHLRSKMTGTYKQCKGQTSKVNCGCTEAMKLSAHTSMSDCIERVYAVEHSAEVVLQFTVDQPGKDPLSLSSEYVLVIEELNNRTNYDCISDFSSSRTRRLKRDLNPNERYLNPEHVTLNMMGSGLYHFKVYVLDGYSYCKLETQFMFYITNTPIVHHLDMLILFSVAVLFGGGLFILYLKYLSLPDRTHERVAERKRLQTLHARKEVD